MQRNTAKAAKVKQAEQSRSDPRLAAFARLLARHAARQDFERELRRKGNGGYIENQPADIAPEDPP